MTLYRAPRTFHAPRANLLTSRLGCYTPDGIIKRFMFSISLASAQANNLPQRSFQAYLVFEIMHDGRPHDVPYLGCPSVGPFKHFEKAAALGVRVEWFDQASRKWLSIPLQIQRFVQHFAKGVAQNDLATAIVCWRRTMDIVQFLEGITYTPPLNGFHAHLNPAMSTIMELRADFLRQTVKWLPRVGRQCPAPEVADFDHNCRLMDELLKNTKTLVNLPEPPPRSSDFWKATDHDRRASGRQIELKCDFCRYMHRSNTKARCERDVRIQGNHVCTYCSILHRPCTFTTYSESLEQWGEGAPHLSRHDSQVRHRALSRFPKGPHRVLAFHMTIPRDMEAAEVEAPFEGVEGLNISSNEDMEVLEEEESDLGDVGDMEDMDAEE